MSTHPINGAVLPFAVYNPVPELRAKILIVTNPYRGGVVPYKSRVSYGSRASVFALLVSSPRTIGAQAAHLTIPRALIWQDTSMLLLLFVEAKIHNGTEAMHEVSSDISQRSSSRSSKAEIQRSKRIYLTATAPINPDSKAPGRAATEGIPKAKRRLDVMHQNPIPTNLGLANPFRQSRAHAPTPHRVPLPPPTILQSPPPHPSIPPQPWPPKQPPA